MIGGLLVDVLVVAAAAAFGWAGLQLGGRASVARLVASYLALLIAVLLRDPAADVAAGVLGTSKDFSTLVGMLAVGVGSWIAVSRVFQWWWARRAPAEGDGPDEPAEDPLEASRPAAAFGGGLLGLTAAVLLVALLVLLPVDSPISRSAVASRTGGLFIEQERVLRWIDDGFPHYTQTLPKGEDGVVVGEVGSLPMRGDHEPTSRPEDADTLLATINDLRRSRSASALAFSPEVSAVAGRHALALATEQVLSYRSPGGAALDSQVRASLAGLGGSFGPDVGIEVVWAHNPLNAGLGLIEDDEAAQLLRDERWTEVGIGVADAGWFDGRVYVLLLVGPPDGDVAEDATAADEAASEQALLAEEGDAGAAAAAGAGPADGASGTDGADASGDPCAGIDLDGDGVPDPQSVDPALVDCPTESGPVEGLGG